MQSDSAACKQPASSSTSSKPSFDDFTAIGSTTAVAQELTPMDIADINWKTQHMPPFPPTTTGLKLVFPPFGMNAAAPPSPGGYGQSGYPPPPPGYPAPPGYGAPPGPPGYTPPPGYPAPPGYGAPPGPPGYPPPPGYSAPASAQGYGPPPPPGYGPPGAGAGGYGGYGPPPPPGKQSTLGVTVMVPCDANLPAGNGQQMQFARGQTYKDRTAGYLFVVAAKEGCPTSDPNQDGLLSTNVGGTGLTWGWIFIILFSVALVLYCGVGAFYKYKKLGVTGIETIPNVEFWRDYPGLVKDGIAFSITKLKACASPGGGYNTV